MKLDKRRTIPLKLSNEEWVNLLELVQNTSDQELCEEGTEFWTDLYLKLRHYFIYDSELS